MTLDSRRSERNFGAPAELWRNTIMSVCSACKFKAVSFSVSPFCKLEVLAEILTTSALSRKAASSNEVRVRVLGSTKKLTRVFPRNAGTFLISREPTVLKAAAESRTCSSSQISNSRMLIRSLRDQLRVWVIAAEELFMVFQRGRSPFGHRFPVAGP